VINQDETWTMTDAYGTSHSTRGVEGARVGSGWANCEGDSGGTVFANLSGNNRQARGIVSAIPGGLLVGQCSNHIQWTEAPDIFSRLGLHLNPKT
jgi:hypothetical protein